MDKLFLMQQIITTLFAVTNKIQGDGDKFFQKLTTRQFMTLLAIAHIPEQKRSMNEVARYMGTSKQNIKQLVLNLEKQGIILFEDNELDKRAKNIVFTKEGEIVCREQLLKGSEYLQSLGEDFTQEELEHLWKLIQKLYAYDGEVFAKYHDKRGNQHN